jgi:hypothetical protein
MLATIIDFDAIWKILLAAFAVGVAVTAIFGEGALAAERLKDARQGRRTGDVLVNGVVVALAGLVCVGALVIGLLAPTPK